MNGRQIINAWAHQMALDHKNIDKIVILTSRSYIVTVPSYLRRERSENFIHHELP
jgi:hypothetical protein